jgi:hypothetical protein
MLGIHRRKQGQAGCRRAAAGRGVHRAAERYGLKLMSMGLIMAEDQVINPLADVAGQVVVETLRSVIWGDLDVLLIDLPPSAGQPQQGLLDYVKLDGVVIVTTPQDLSLLDSSRSLLMYEKAGAPVLGLVENMSYFICPGCGERHEIFQHSTQWRPEALQNVPVLGRIPLTAEISKGIDRNHPLMADYAAGAAPTPGESAQAAAFLDIARAVQARLPRTEATDDGPGAPTYETLLAPYPIGYVGRAAGGLRARRRHVHRPAAAPPPPERHAPCRRRRAGRALAWGGDCKTAWCCPRQTTVRAARTIHHPRNASRCCWREAERLHHRPELLALQPG